MTLPTAYSWSAVGQTLYVPYEAAQARRVNVIGGYFSHGQEAGRFDFASYASIPKSTGKRKTPQARAAAHGVAPNELGPIDAERFLTFLWRLAGRPTVTLLPWQRVRPLHIVLDNYSVHKNQHVQAALPALEAANVFLFYLPAYSPQLSEIEPIWRSVKAHGMPYRSQAVLGNMKQAVDVALDAKAQKLQQHQVETTSFQCLAT